MTDPAQKPLFDKGERYENEWKGMPEFVQENLEPYKTIYVHFESRDDMEAFARLIGQSIGLNTRSIWYPEAEIGHFADRRYIDELLEESTEEIIEDGE